MPPSTTKTLSPAELAKLEHAFATDPASEAYKPLAEAYLSMGRFMEAMVVCKKGVKAHPTIPDARVLLARVYADQGKDKKAIEELQSALQVSATDKHALRLLGALQMKSGETEVGKANLLKAFQSDPADAETLATMQQLKVEAPKAAPPPAPPPPPAGATATSQAQQPTGMSLPNIDITVASSANLPPVGSRSNLPPVLAPPSQSRPTLQPVVQGRPPPSRPSAPPTPKASGRRQVVDDDEDEDDDSSARPARAKKGSGAARAVFFLLLFVVPLSAAAYYAIGQYKAVQAREVKALLTKANEFLKTDTYASYKSASEAAERALDKDPNNAAAHSYLAYSYAIRWGEHERDDGTRAKAEEHLREAKAGDKEYSHLYAAEALYKFYSGKGAEARTELEALVKKLESENKRPALLQLTLGIIEMNQGDLEDAKETLERAQGNASDDPRVYVALGTLNRRRGNDSAALAQFNSALKYTRNSHPEGLLGTAQLIIDQENPGGGYITAARYLKTLLDSTPPPSPRQLAVCHFVRAALISRVSTDLPLYTDKKFQQELQDGTGVSPDPSKARSDVQKEEEAGLALDRSNPELFLIRGKRLASERKLDEAAAEIRKAIEMNGQLAHYHVELARVLMRKEGGEKDAEVALRKAVSLVPNSPKLLSILGQVLYRQKKVDEAKTTLEKAVADPKTKNPEARYLLGRLLRDDKKDLTGAIALLEQAAKEYFSEPGLAANTFYELAQTYELKGDKDRARAQYEKALNADKDFAATYCAYARLLTKLGDAKDKDLIKNAAKEYVRLEPQGECAPEMQRTMGG